MCLHIDDKRVMVGREKSIMQNDNTMHKIIKLEHERHELYKLAGHRQLTAKQRERITQIAGELTILWDQHRREDAARRWGPRSMSRKDTSAA